MKFEGEFSGDHDRQVRWTFLDRSILDEHLDDRLDRLDRKDRDENELAR